MWETSCCHKRDWSDSALEQAVIHSLERNFGTQTLVSGLKKKKKINTRWSVDQGGEIFFKKIKQKK